MPPKLTLPGRPSPFQQELRISHLYNRLASPAPPTAPEVVDRGLIRTILDHTSWDVAAAEQRFRQYRLHLRTQPAAGPSAGAQHGPTTRTDAQQGTGDAESSQSDASSSSSSDNFTDAGGPAPPQIKPYDQNLLDAIKNSRIPLSTGEQQRRDAALALQIAIEESESVKLSISEAVLLMQLAEWDISVAVASFNNVTESRRILRFHFDSLRQLVDNVDDQIQQSKCLQLLTEITGRSDWFSLFKVLQDANWNLIKIIVRWYKYGIPVFEDKDLPKQKRKITRWGLRVDRYGRRLTKPDAASTNPAGDGDFSNWAKELKDYSHPADKDPVTPFIYGKKWRDEKVDRAKKAAKRQSTRNDRQEGFEINKDREPVKPGLVYDGSFLLEWYHRGQYWFKVFNKSDYQWPEAIHSDSDSDSDNDSDSDSSPPPGPAPVPFDPENKAHLADLNKWRMNNHYNITGQIKRLATQKWRPEELDFLYQLQQELYEWFKKQYPRSTRREIMSAILISNQVKGDWERRFNAKFAGTTPPGQTETRRFRLIGAILQQRFRFARLATHFRIKLNSEWKAKKQHKTEKDAIRQFKKERNEMEAKSEEETQRYNDTHPTDDPVEGRVTTTVRKEAPSSSEADSVNGNGGIAHRPAPGAADGARSAAGEEGDDRGVAAGEGEEDEEDETAEDGSRGGRRTRRRLE